MKTICGSDALARAALVSDRQWISLMADPVFCNQVEFVLGAGVWPAAGKLCDGGSGMNYITGLILLLREQKEAANVPFPRGVLHELCRPQLPKLVDMFNVTVNEPLAVRPMNEAIAKQVNDTQALWSGVRRAEVIQQVRRLMREKGLRNIDLAKRLGIAEGSMSRILKGKQNIEIDTMYRLADALEVPLTICFGDGLSERLANVDAKLKRIGEIVNSL